MVMMKICSFYTSDLTISKLSFKAYLGDMKLKYLESFEVIQIMEEQPEDIDIVMTIAGVERLFSIVDIYWSHFPYLISNLSFDEERVSIARTAHTWLKTQQYNY
jgi:hypothetical protein